MDDPLLHDLVAMGKFLGSLDRVGVKAEKKGRRSEPRVPAVASMSATPPLALLPPIPDSREPRVEIRAAVSGRDGSAIEIALQSIKDDMGDCKRCRLCEGRTKIVHGQGNAAAELMFVGEAPGADEDVQGLAFVGRAGQLLTDMVEKGMKMKRADVFIANVIKCRPPGQPATRDG